MINRLVEVLCAKPLFGSNYIPVVAIGQIVISSIAMGHLQYMQQEYIDCELRHNRHHSEGEVVPEIALPDLVGLSYLGLIRKLNDEQQQPWNRENSLGLRGILHN